MKGSRHRSNIDGVDVAEVGAEAAKYILLGTWCRGLRPAGRFGYIGLGTGICYNLEI